MLLGWSCRRGLPGCEEIFGQRELPSLDKEGWLRDQEISRSVPGSRRRGGCPGIRFDFPGQHHPGRSSKEASQPFLSVASTPPRLRRGASLARCSLTSHSATPSTRSYVSERRIDPCFDSAPEAPRVRCTPERRPVSGIRARADWSRV